MFEIIQSAKPGIFSLEIYLVKWLIHFLYLIHIYSDFLFFEYMLFIWQYIYPIHLNYLLLHATYIFCFLSHLLFSHIPFLLVFSNAYTSAVFEAQISNCLLNFATFNFHWFLQIRRCKTQLTIFFCFPSGLVSINETIFQSPLKSDIREIT